MNDIKIREAVQDDSVEIVALLKRSLGESMLPKSVDYWNWKHYENPFGVSKILLAEVENKIAGVRAFLKWNWQNSHSIITAVRAVDTATDPLFQGKGIFTQLSLAALEQCKTEGIDMVFNTPNKKSKPGYIKMGWEEAGRVPLDIQPCFHLPARYSELVVDKVYADYPVDIFLKSIPESIDLSNPGVKYDTAVSANYFQWRYACCPVVKYGVKGYPGELFFFFRLKKVGRFIELRICDVWNKKGVEGSKSFNRALSNLIHQVRPLFVSIAPDFKGVNKKSFRFQTNLGPVTTVRTLAKKEIGDFKFFKNWQPSIGSMELF